MRHWYCLITMCLLCACSGREEPVSGGQLTASQVLASEDVAGYLRADTPRRFSFPEDHGPHSGFRNEWWYLTGNLETQDGDRFGYQVTFFSSLLRPDSQCEGESSWCTDGLWMGHAAVSDVSAQVHYKAEIFSRENPGLAGARQDPFRVWVQDWQLFSASNNFPWELEVIEDEFALTLTLSPVKQPVLQGIDGLSRKNAEPGNASYYYSMSRLAATGRVHLNGESHEVSGSGWLDREWSTSALGKDQSGWDWFSLQFDDGSELMYYQLRDLQGDAHSYSSGNFTSLMGAQTPVSPDEISLEALSSWQAPNGTVYTTAWRMGYRDRSWLVRAVFENQLMNLTFQYWEGAVDVIDERTGEGIGRGYLEMVR